MTPTRRPSALDWIIAVLIAALALTEPWSGRSGWAAAIGVGMAAAVLFRRVRPLWSGAVVGVLGVVQCLLAAVYAQADGPGPFLAPALYDIAVPVSIYSLALYAPRSWQARAAGAGAVLSGVLSSVRFGEDWWKQSLFLTAIAATAWSFGLVSRTRRLYVRGLEERAEALVREQRHLAEAAAAEERTRIAREMHDVIAHGLAGMLAQVDGAAYAFDSSPDKAREAVHAAGDAGRRALAEIQQLVAVLRSPPGPDVAAPRRRPLGTERLADLEEWAASVGLDTEFTVDGDAAGLPIGIALAVHRIVQESLTNALKHAGRGTRVTVHVGHSDDRVDVKVADEGNGEPMRHEAPDGGHGLAGMRERVAVYGGEFRAGPRPGGGWVVTARIPIPHGTGGAP